MMLNDLTYKIRGAIFSVYNELGPGLLESIYEAALSVEFDHLGLMYQAQVPVNVLYKGKDLGLAYRMDLLVDNLIIIEIKSVTEIQDIHLKQLNTYLKITQKPLGLLVNFNSLDLNKSIKRVINSNIKTNFDTDTAVR